MNLREALLCVECEWLYAETASCPRCGSRVSFPIARTMNRRRAALARFTGVRRSPPPATAAAVAFDDVRRDRRRVAASAG